MSDKVIKADQVKMDAPVMPHEKTRVICDKQDNCPLICGQCGREHDVARTSKLIPHCCPVCTGSGIVSRGFYNRTGDTYTSCGGTETCRACNGRGIVWG